MDSLSRDLDAVDFTGVGSIGVLDRFRREFHACLRGRAVELIEVADAVACGQGPVRSLAELSLDGLGSVQTPSPPGHP